MYEVQSDDEVEREERKETGNVVDYIGTTLAYSPPEPNFFSQSLELIASKTIGQEHALLLVDISPSWIAPEKWGEEFNACP